MSDKTYNKPPWIKTGRRTRAMRSAKKQKNMELREKRRAEDEEPEYPCDVCGKPAKYNFQDTTVRYEIIDDDFENPKVSDYGGQNQNDFYCEVHSKQYESSDFHTLKSEEGNTPVQEPMEFGEMANWRPMDGTPGLKRQRAETFNAYSDPISDRQVYKIKQLGGKVDSTMNRSQASDYIKDLMGVPSRTWKAHGGIHAAEYISDLSNGIVQFEDGYGFSSASAPPNDIHFGAENQVFALTYWINEGVNIDDINDVSEALELYLSLSDDILEMEDMELQKHPRYELAKKLQSDLSYRMDELQTAVPDITTDIEMDAEYDAWRSAFADGASATMLHKYDRNWMNKVNNPRSTYIKSYWNDSEPEFMEELRSAEGLTPTETKIANTFQWLEDNTLALSAGILAAMLSYIKL